MAANAFCEACGKKGRVTDGLCHECYDDVVSERWESPTLDFGEYEFS